MEIGGVRLKKGDKIMAMLAAANMDPNAKDDPEKLDLHRHPNRHLALGTGIHFCLGYQLARIEGKCALEALFGRWPKLELAIKPADIRWRKRPGLRAIEKLPVVARPQSPLLALSGRANRADECPLYGGITDIELVSSLCGWRGLGL